MRYELGDVRVSKRNRLPHWDPEQGIQFVTFNLHDAMPVHLRDRIRNEAQAQLELIERTRGTPTIADRVAVAAWTRRQLQRVLDQNHGSCVLGNPDAARIVDSAIRFLDTRKYALINWSVMPNHVHLVYSCCGVSTREVMKSLKGYTSHEINRMLGRCGTLWQADYMDRTIRDSQQLEGTVKYVLNNPSAAGLENWPFVGVIAENLAKAL